MASKLGQKLRSIVAVLGAGIIVLIVRQVYKMQRLRKLLKERNPHLNPEVIYSGGILGSIVEAAKNWNRLYDYRLGLMHKYGETYATISAIWNLTPIVITTNPDNVKHILKTEFDIYIKSEILIDLLYDLLGKGIFAVNHGTYANDGGAAWTLQRKTASKIFTRNVFQGKMYDVFAENSLKIANRLQSIDGKRSIDMQTMLFKFTMDSIGSVGFGVDLKTLDTEENAWFAESFDNAQKLSFLRMTKPFYKYLGSFYASEKALAEHIAKMDKFSYGVIDERLREKDLSGKQDILSHFIQHFRDENVLSLNTPPREVVKTRKFLRDVVMSFFIAGRDTTACLLSFSFMILCTHQDIQSKLLEEIEQELPASSPEEFRPPTLEELKRGFPYLTGVIQESLRLFPPVPGDGKMACQDDILPDGTFVPAGGVVSFDIYSMGRSEKLWGPDASEPRPERWILEDGSKRTVEEWMFPVFQPGRRKCLGADLAVFEAKVLVVELVRRFSFKMERPPLEPPYATGITMTVNDGLPLIATPRYH
eukprot:CAMPEP_0171498550 /NCGR_PEP_ID=MMETSP0958-20121227/7920_1 /TAXON_ID=87120 /ORGANISM="Aurantiochytrium limacinum, Strain ATCCMYA-1381" /LENGTH=533 /DNA_ID=CAMNT_0012032977 /DNA_START=111 /DNA_END=1712 /DNA_ORIENTATION=+